MDLVRRDVIRPDFADFPGDEAYRFRHALIRDAAYRSLSKGTSADLHERFAGWLERAAGERLREFEEIVGYHLEQAYRCRAAIGSIDTHTATLATRSAQRLESAGRRALARSDLPAAIGLLERAADLLALDAPRRAALLPELGAALIEAGRWSDAEPVLAEATTARRFGRGRSRRLACAGSAAVPAAACGSTKEQPRRERAWSKPSIPVFETYRRRARPVQSPEARGVDAVEHGARRGGSRGLGARRQSMPAARATRTSETRSCPGSRRRCSSGRPRCPKGSAAVRRFAPRWSATPAPRPGRSGRSPGSTRWWAASSSPGRSSPRQTRSSRSSGRP